MHMEMLFFLIFIVGTQWAAGTQTAGSCSPEALLTCTKIIASTASHQVSLRMYSQQELDSLCSHEFVAVKKCLQPIKADCDVSVSVVFDAFVDTLQFMCSNVGKHGYVEHGKCLKRMSIQTDLHQCLTSHQERSQSTTMSAQNYAKVMCGLNMEYNACLRRAVEPHCGTEAAQWVLAMSAADHKAVSAMLECDQVTPTETPEMPIRRVAQDNLETVSSGLSLTPEPSVGCTWEDLDLCMKPLEQLGSKLRKQLTAKTLDNVCRSGLPHHQQCKMKVRSHCSPVQVQHLDMAVRAFRAACQHYTKGSNRHQKCWRKDAVQSAMTVCARMHHLAVNMRTAGSGEEGSGGSGDVPHEKWCRTAQAYLDCTVDATESFCPSQTGQWIWRTMNWILQSTSAHLQCQFRYHPRVTSSIAAIVPIVTSSKPRVTSSTAIVTSSMTILMSSTPMTKSSMPMTMSSTSMISSPTFSMMPPMHRMTSSTPRATSSTPRATPSTPSMMSSTLSVASSTPSTMSSTPSMTSSMLSTTSPTPSTTSSMPSMTSPMLSVTSSSDLTTATLMSVPNIGSLEEGSGWSIAFGGALGVGAVVLLAGMVCISILLCKKLFKRQPSGDTESVASLPSHCESMAYSDQSSTVTHADYCQARDGSVMLTIPQFSF